MQARKQWQNVFEEQDKKMLAENSILGKKIDPPDTDLEAVPPL